jgi:hypothetical protein
MLDIAASSPLMLLWRELPEQEDLGFCEPELEDLVSPREVLFV